MTVSPRIQAMILAEKVYQDVLTKQYVIAGTFNSMKLRKAQPPKESATGQRTVSVNDVRRAGNPWLFLSITELQAEVQFTIRIVYLVDNSVLCEANFRLSSEDRLATKELAVPLPSFSFRGAGHYAVEVFAADEMIGTYRVIATQDESDVSIDE